MPNPVARQEVQFGQPNVPQSTYPAVTPSSAARMPHTTQSLDVSGNPCLAGTLPSSWAALTALQRLSLSGTNVTLPPVFPVYPVWTTPGAAVPHTHSPPAQPPVTFSPAPSPAPITLQSVVLYLQFPDLKDAAAGGVAEPLASALQVDVTAAAVKLLVEPGCARSVSVQAPVTAAGGPVVSITLLMARQPVLAGARRNRAGTAPPPAPSPPSPSSEWTAAHVARLAIRLAAALRERGGVGRGAQPYVPPPPPPRSAVVPAAGGPPGPAHMSGGAIAGVAVGSAAGLMVLVTLVGCVVYSARAPRVDGSKSRSSTGESTCGPKPPANSHSSNAATTSRLPTTYVPLYDLSICRACSNDAAAGCSGPHVGAVSHSSLLPPMLASVQGGSQGPTTQHPCTASTNAWSTILLNPLADPCAPFVLEGGGEGAGGRWGGASGEGSEDGTGPLPTMVRWGQVVPDTQACGAARTPRRMSAQLVRAAQWSGQELGVEGAGGDHDDGSSSSLRICTHSAGAAGGSVEVGHCGERSASQGGGSWVGTLEVDVPRDRHITCDNSTGSVNGG